MEQASENPEVCVLLAVHNGLPYVESAVRSMMGQNLCNIEIVVVDDASTDGTPDVLKRLAGEDSRIRIVTAEKNLRLPGALNFGLGVARAPLIARMDADDLSEPRRLDIQKTYMDRHPDVILLGSSVTRIDGAGRLLRSRSTPRDDFANRWIARFQVPQIHPSYMFRRLNAQGEPLLYDTEWAIAEDYEFTTRVMQMGKLVNLPDLLVHYRQHGGATSATRHEKQKSLARQLALRVLMRDLPANIAHDMTAFLDLYYGPGRATPQAAAALCAGLERMIAHDRRTAPEKTRWMRRNAASLLILALQRGGMSSKAVARVLLGPGRGFAMPVLFRTLENRDMLPRWLASAPSV